MSIKDKILPLVCGPYDKLVAALDAADRETTTLRMDIKHLQIMADEREALKAENEKLLRDAERYRAIRKATLTEDDAFMDALDDAGTPKTDAQFDSAFDAAINAARAALGGSDAANT